ncbi:MAG: URC4/urg3 family protein [Pseudorhodoplanes sp.]|nr:URC4/urg3 family protein [Pseudorhodoplanes sp.]
MLDAGLAGDFQEFTIDLAALKPAAAFVARVIRQNYPDLNVPLHARWRHFTAQGRDLWAAIAGKAKWPDAAARARAAFDLAIVSVLLDAGAGPDWTYRDAATGLVTGRSEGLAIASVRMFEAGAFSGDPRDSLRADASKLSDFTAAQLAAGFQVSADNPLAGLEGRGDLLARLGKTMAAAPSVFAMKDSARPGGLFDALARDAKGRAISAPDILRALLVHLGPIWPGRVTLGGLSLGDTWKHPAIKRTDATNGLVPFHKLSQWLSYSLIEPLQAAGFKVTDINGLTGLAEYRNGGLFVDANVIALRDPAKALLPNVVDSPLVVEWRALTIALLDRIAPLVRAELGVDELKFPLGCVLEGGTWAAGRVLAREKRADAGPPIRVVSDGTVF